MEVYLYHPQTYRALRANRLSHTWTQWGEPSMTKSNISTSMSRYQTKKLTTTISCLFNDSVNASGDLGTELMVRCFGCRYDWHRLLCPQWHMTKHGSMLWSRDLKWRLIRRLSSWNMSKASQSIPSSAALIVCKRSTRQRCHKTRSNGFPHKRPTLCASLINQYNNMISRRYPRWTITWRSKLTQQMKVWHINMLYVSGMDTPGMIGISLSWWVMKIYLMSLWWPLRIPCQKNWTKGGMCFVLYLCPCTQGEWQECQVCALFFYFSATRFIWWVCGLNGSTWNRIPWPGLNIQCVLDRGSLCTGSSYRTQDRALFILI